MEQSSCIGVAFCQLYGIFTFVIHISIRVSVVPVKLIIQQIWGWGICDLLMARYLRWLFCFFFFSVCELVIFLKNIIIFVFISADCKTPESMTEALAAAGLLTTTPSLNGSKYRKACLLLICFSSLHPPPFLSIVQGGESFCKSRFKFGDFIRKVDKAGKVLCEWCDDTINYAKRGKAAVLENKQTSGECQNPSQKKKHCS